MCLLLVTHTYNKNKSNMKKIVRVTENDLTKIVRKVIKEQEDLGTLYGDRYQSHSTTDTNNNRTETRSKSNTGGESMELTKDDVRGGFPDLSGYEQLDQVSAINCGLTEMPPAEFLPEGLTMLSIHDNQIRNVDLNGYDRFRSLFVVNVYNNPVNSVDVDGLESILSHGDLTRFAISNPESIENYEQYKEMLDSFNDNNGNTGFYADI